MKRLLIVLAAALMMTAAVCAQAATEVRMTGDVLVYGNYMSKRNFTGWNRSYWSSNAGTVQGARTQAEENFEIWERFRLRSDFVANEAVKFRLGLLVEDTWGHGTFTAANPSASTVDTRNPARRGGGIEVYQAYLQFKWPGTEIQVTAGLQPAALPQSSLFAGSVVFDENVSGLVVTIPANDNFTVLLGYVRTISSSQTFSATAGNIDYPNEEGFLLALPITVDGFKAIPWIMYGQGGPAGNYLADGGWTEGLVAPAFAGWKNRTIITALWAGASLDVTILDPIKFYADVIWGAHGMNEPSRNYRAGWFIDAAVEYTGLEMVTPQVFGWWSTGEDSNVRNGSERMPHFFPGSGNGGEHNGGAIAWNAGNSFLFDGGQELVKGSNMGINPVGAYGAGISLNKMTFIEKLSHVLTFAYVHGNNSPRAIRWTLINNALMNPLFNMGRDLTWNEWAMGVNLDSKYMLYDNLALILETGWAHSSAFQRSVWGRSLANQAGDAWKVAFGLKYTF